METSGLSSQKAASQTLVLKTFFLRILHVLNCISVFISILCFFLVLLYSDPRTVGRLIDEMCRINPIAVPSIKKPSLPEHFKPPACYGSEEPGCNVSGGVDGIAAIAAQRHADKHHQETHDDRLRASRRGFVLLVRQSHHAQQQHRCSKHLESNKQHILPFK